MSTQMVFVCVVPDARAKALGLHQTNAETCNSSSNIEISSKKVYRWQATTMPCEGNDSQTEVIQKKIAALSAFQPLMIKLICAFYV